MYILLQRDYKICIFDIVKNDKLSHPRRLRRFEMTGGDGRKVNLRRWRWTEHII